MPTQYVYALGINKILAKAYGQAMLFNHDEIRPDHIFLALVDGESNATRVIRNLDVNPQIIKDIVEQHLVQGEARTKRVKLPLTDLSVKAIDAAIGEALRQDVLIGTDHILLGLLGDTTSHCTKALDHAKITRPNAREESQKINDVGNNSGKNKEVAEVMPDKEKKAPRGLEHGQPERYVEDEFHSERRAFTEFAINAETQNMLVRAADKCELMITEAEFAVAIAHTLDKWPRLNLPAIYDFRRIMGEVKFSQEVLVDTSILVRLAISLNASSNEILYNNHHIVRIPLELFVIRALETLSDRPYMYVRGEKHNVETLFLEARKKAMAQS
jgi:hypothetical protein